MSEPVSKSEIEDVLSSIRRLVSENTGAVRRDAAILQAADKLVLTPAFRVDEDDAETTEAQTGADQAEDVGAAEADEPSPEHAVAEVIDAHAAPVEAETVSEVGGEPLAAEPDSGEMSLPDGAPQAAASIESELVQTENATEDAAEAPAPRAVSPLEQRIAELEAVVAQSAAEFEPDGSEVEVRHEEFMFHRHAAAESKPDQVLSAEPITDAGPAPEPEAPVSSPEVVVAPDAEVAVAPDAEDVPNDEPVVESDEWEDVEVSSDASAPADEWDELGEPDAETEPDTGAEGDAEAVIDENALRELVARMVREELQGSVGERITHNVRRMVRREISRALSLQEFE
jgi:hypothetical protein